MNAAPRRSGGRTGIRSALVAAVVAALAFGGFAAAAPALADPPYDPVITVSPAHIEVGGTSAITVTGIGDLPTATLGMDATSGASFTESGTTQYSAPVVDGVAHATFTATDARAFTIALSDGENVIGRTTVTVVATEPPAPKPVASTAALGPQPAGPVAGQDSVTPAVPADTVSMTALLTTMLVSIVVIAGILIAWLIVDRRRALAAGADS